MKLQKQLESLIVIYISIVFYSKIDSVAGLGKGPLNYTTVGRTPAHGTPHDVDPPFYIGENRGKPGERLPVVNSDQYSHYYEKIFFRENSNFLSVVWKYLSRMPKQTNEKKEVNKTFSKLLFLYKQYSQKYRNAIPNYISALMESAKIIEKLINFHGNKLPNDTEPKTPGNPDISDISDNIINDYRQKRSYYSRREEEYLTLLARYYTHQEIYLSNQIGFNFITKAIKDKYSEVKRLHSDYSQLHESLLKKNISADRINIYTLQELPEEPILYILKPHGYLNKDQNITENEKKENYIIQQHNEARLNYYWSRLDYSTAVSEFLNEVSLSSYLKVIFEYKKLVDLGNLYHEVYLYVYKNNVTSDEKYPFPQIPDVIIDSSIHWLVDYRKFINQTRPFWINEGNVTDVVISQIESGLKYPLALYEHFFESFMDDPENEVMYYLTICYFNDFLRRFSVFDVLYQYWVANGKVYNKQVYIPSKFSNIAHIDSLIRDHINLRPKSKIIPQLFMWRNHEKYAKSLLNDPPDVSSWEMKTLTSEYLINSAWNIAMFDLLNIRPNEGMALDYTSMPLTIVTVENRGNLIYYEKLCMFLKSERKKGGNKSGNLIQCPITQTFFIPPDPDSVITLYSKKKKIVSNPRSLLPCEKGKPYCKRL